MKNLFTTSVLCLTLTLLAQRQEIPFNTNWNFEMEMLSGLVEKQTIDLPHTWNIQDVQQGITQHRGVGTYTKIFDAPLEWQSKRIFIHFEAANIITTVQLNGKKIG